MAKPLATILGTGLLILASASMSSTPTRPAGGGVADPIRDSNGIAHLVAHSELRLLFLQGWVHARDRLFQMDSARHRAEGTLAELLGSRVLAEDVRLRRLGLRRAAERGWPLLNRELQAALRAYAAGVNDYVTEHGLPADYAMLELATFRPWTEIDSLCVLSLAVFESADRSGAAEALGLSFNGAALHAGQQPAFHAIHLRAPGFEVSGASFPGVPYVARGHNAHVAWSISRRSRSLTSLHQERVVTDAHAASGLSTLHAGRREPVLALPLVFRINAIGDGGFDSLLEVPSGGLVPERLLIVPRRNHGALISMDTRGTALSLQYLGASAPNVLRALRQLSVARCLDDFTAAVSDVGAGFDFIYQAAPARAAATE